MAKKQINRKTNDPPSQREFPSLSFEIYLEKIYLDSVRENKDNNRVAYFCTDSDKKHVDLDQKHGRSLEDKFMFFIQIFRDPL